MLTRLLTGVGQLMVQTRLLVKRLEASVASVYYNTITTLDDARSGQATRAADRAVDHHWGGGARRMLHAGLPQARAIVRNKAGKHVEFTRRICSVVLATRYLFGTVIRGSLDGVKMPLQALAGYRAIFGLEGRACVGDLRPPGGYATTTLRALTDRGQEDWHPAQRPRSVARCRGRPRDGQERAWQDPSLRCIGTFGHRPLY